MIGRSPQYPVDHVNLPNKGNLDSRSRPSVQGRMIRRGGKLWRSHTEFAGILSI